MRTKELTKYKEKIILKYIYDQGGSVTTNEISQATGISYITVNKYLKKLVKERILVEE